MGSVKLDDLSRDQLESRLREVMADADLRTFELQALMNGAKSVLSEKTFAEAARAIFDYCCDLIGAPSGYVALLNESGEENEVLFLESGGLPCTVDEELPMPIRGLRGEAYATQKAVYDNDFMNSEWVKYMPEGHVVLKNVLFAPLNLEGKTVGIIGLANKEGDFNDNDAKIATGFGELAAIALQNSKALDERIEADQQKQAAIEELQEALAMVKKMSGLLPICATCKKIRDDKGYWSQIETYIKEHSEANFSHSLCPECAKEYLDTKDGSEDKD
jgi:hypothetical protein